MQAGLGVERPPGEGGGKRRGAGLVAHGAEGGVGRRADERPTGIGGGEDRAERVLVEEGGRAGGRGGQELIEAGASMVEADLAAVSGLADRYMPAWRTRPRFGFLDVLVETASALTLYLSENVEGRCCGGNCI